MEFNGYSEALSWSGWHYSSLGVVLGVQIAGSFWKASGLCF